MQEQKFKVGDKVVRITSGYGETMKGGVYEVSEVSDKSFLNSYGINLKGHETISGKFTYEASGFELYTEEYIKEKPNTLGILTPLQAAEAILNKDKLQVYDSDCDKWYTFACGHRNITIEDLKHIKLRLKPKTISINGVEVPSPMSDEEIGNCEDRRTGYYIELAHKCVYSKRIFSNQIVWATEEDAQKALDAMLIPFNQL